MVIVIPKRLKHTFSTVYNIIWDPWYKYFFYEPDLLNLVEWGDLFFFVYISLVLNIFYDWIVHPVTLLLNIYKNLIMCIKIKQGKEDAMCEFRLKVMICVNRRGFIIWVQIQCLSHLRWNKVCWEISTNWNFGLVF